MDMIRDLWEVEMILDYSCGPSISSQKDTPETGRGEGGVEMEAKADHKPGQAKVGKSQNPESP